MSYPIQNDANYFWTGRDLQNDQVILGLLAPDVVVYHFDGEGKYMRKEVISLAHPPTKEQYTGIYRLDSEFMTQFSSELDEIKSRVGYRPGAVSIQSFFDPTHHVGLMAYPSTYQEFLDFPERFSEQQKKAYGLHLEKWTNDRNFVFCWAEEYWMNHQGEIES
jgi:hypothetical protein